jgi:hypothetical protein
MSGNERRLAKILAVLSAAAALFVAVALAADRVAEARNRVAEYEDRIARLSSVAVDEEGLRSRLRSVEEGIGREERRARAASESSTSDFGAAAKRLLAANGISPLRYQSVSASRGEELEFSLRCEAGGFFAFLCAATGERGDWRVPYLSIHTGGSGELAEIVVRLSK